jgi:hypothetical protein
MPLLELFYKRLQSLVYVEDHRRINRSRRSPSLRMLQDFRYMRLSIGYLSTPYGVDPYRWIVDDLNSRDIVHFTELDDKAWTSFEFESLAHGCDPTIKKRICFVYVNTTGP